MWTGLHMLANKGRGNRFLQDIGQNLQHSRNIIGAETADSSMGVWQDGPTSCSLFTFHLKSKTYYQNYQVL